MPVVFYDRNIFLKSELKIMASRISFYCAVFLGMFLYDTSEALNCYTQTSCSGSGCTGAETIDPVDTPCQAGFDACLRVSWEVTVSGEKADFATLGCSLDHGLGNGCSSLDDLPPSIAAAYENLGVDSFEYCLCDQDLCNSGSIKATSTLPVMIGSLLFTLLAFFRQA